MKHCLYCASPLTQIEIEDGDKICHECYKPKEEKE